MLFFGKRKSATVPKEEPKPQDYDDGTGLVDKLKMAMKGRRDAPKEADPVSAAEAAAVRVKNGERNIKDRKVTAMSASMDSSGAALACMRAALEQVDLGARGGLATLGARHRLRIPQPDAETQEYTAKQFEHKHVRRAFDGLGQNPGTKEDKNFLEYVQAYQTYQDQDNTVARAAKRRAADAARHSEHAKRPRVLEAVEIEEEDLAPPRAAPRRRSAVSGADEEALERVRREYDGAGSSRGGGGAAGGGAYAREPFDSDVVEVGPDEAAADERARRRRREMEDQHARDREAERRRAETERMAEAERAEEQRKWDEAFCKDMDDWYK